MPLNVGTPASVSSSKSRQGVENPSVVEVLEEKHRALNQDDSN
jgi:hypothetical protein